MHTSAGHRQRVKKRYRKEGLDSFDEVHVLELLLFYVIPRVDTKPVARALLDHFGTFHQVLEATQAELEGVPGVGENAATFLTLFNAVGRYYRTSRGKEIRILRTIEQCGEYLENYFHGRRNETVVMLCLDAKCKVLCCRVMGEGSVNSANIPIRKMVEVALGVNATSVVLAHNHPSGVALPSAEDRETTRLLASALGAMNIILSDHLIFADDEFVSLVQSRLYNPNEYC